MNVPERYPSGGKKAGHTTVRHPYPPFANLGNMPTTVYHACTESEMHSAERSIKMSYLHEIDADFQ